MFKIITLLFSLSFLLFSCSSQDKESIEKVSILQEKVSKMQNKYNNIDHLGVKVAQKEYNENMFLVKKYYFKDTIDKEFMTALDIYRGIKIGTKGIGKINKAIENSLTLTKNQLSDLKEDLNNVSIQGELAKSAIETETKNVNRIDSALNIYILNVDNILFAHDSVASYIRNKTRTF